MKRHSLTIERGGAFNSVKSSAFPSARRPATVSALGLTVVHVFQDPDCGGGVVPPQTAPDGQGQADVEALLSFIQGVVDDHHAAPFLPLALVEAEDAAVLLRAGDVVGIGQDGGGNRPHGRTFTAGGENTVKLNPWVELVQLCCMKANETQKLMKHTTHGQ